MVMVNINGVERYYDGYLKQNLEALQQFVAMNWDGVVYFGGYEGDGKSTLALQCAAFVDKSFTVDRVVFTPEQFLAAVESASPGQCIVYDEAQDAFDSGNRDQTAKLLKMKLTRIRKKRLYIFIVAADFWRINKYLFIHRSRAFIRVYADGLERGRFAFYNREKKHELYIKGKKEENLKVISPNFIGRYTSWKPIDEEAYERKKDEATAAIGKDEPEIDEKLLKVEQIKAEIKLLEFLKRNRFLKDGAITAAMERSGVSVGTWQSYREKALNETTNPLLLTEGGGFKARSRTTINTNNLPMEPSDQGELEVLL